MIDYIMLKCYNTKKEVVFMTKIKNIKNQRFGKLIAKEYSHTEKGKSSTWICKCDCGNIIPVVISSLNSGNTQSCGCFRLERIKEAVTTHGEGRSTEYIAWGNMIQRCTNPNNPEYINYGGRNITICEEWKNSFETFLNDMGRKPDKKFSLDRIDNNKGYYKENCRWTNCSIQAINQRDKKNKTTGIKNISYSKRDNLYYVGIERKGKRYRKAFKNLENAIDWKKQILSNLTSTTIKREG